MARPFAMVSGAVQWAACDLDGVRVAPDGAVELATVDADVSPGAGGPDEGGLAFDRGCRIYRTTSEGGIERVLWSRRRDADAPVVLRLVAASEPGDPGDPGDPEDPGECADEGAFAPATEDEPPLEHPTGLAADDGDRLFVAEAGKQRILIYDLWSRRLVRRVDLAPWTPLDLATDGDGVYVVPDGADFLFRLTARGVLERVALPAGVDTPSRVDVCRTGTVALLTGGGGADASLVLLAHERDSLGRRLPTLVATHGASVPGGTDVVFQDRDVVVVARGPGVDMARFHVREGSLVDGRAVFGRGYPGGGIARSPDGCVSFWGVLGPQCGVDAPVRYVASGQVTSARLDSGTFRTVWGRLFLDATLPRGARLTVRCVTSDQEERPTALDDDDAVFSPLHCREMGREIPWTTSPADLPFRTQEAPVLAGAGRYLWVQIRFEGNTRVRPRVRALRAEYPSHDYLRRLPRGFSRDPDAADFLRRFLTLPAGFLQDVEAKANQRHQLLIPETTPAEMLPWLAGFVGMVLDERWPEHTRRALVREAVPLFRTRGTPASLVRFLELFIGEPVRLVEHFRLRGVGGSFLGGGGAPESNAVLGGGFRVGGAIGTGAEADTATDAAAAGPDGYAHRFTVLLGRELTEDELEAVHLILEVHRPAHTVYDLCTVGAGMRVGRGLHVALSSIVGPTGGFTSAQVGAVVLGREAVLGTRGGIHAGEREGHR